MILTLNTPLTHEKIKTLKAGDLIRLNGSILGARDAAHKRLIGTISRGLTLPVELANQTIFYVGPSPTPPGKTSGSVGPTTSARMDNLTEPLLQKGVCATIGKGARSKELRELLIKYKAIYFIAPGGVAAYLAGKIKKIETIAYDDLGAEAIFNIEVKDFPVIVAYDIYGGDIFDISK